VTRYLLDTDTLSWLVRDPAGAVAGHAATVGAGALATSPIVAGELRFGAARSGSAQLVERVVVTGNVREFRRVVGLGVEDWREG
jgi:tRNA(fMet)-specific endonuclease VapC